MSCELAYYGWEEGCIWAFRDAEELGKWAAEHPAGTWDVQLKWRNFRCLQCGEETLLSAEAACGIATQFCQKTGRPITEALADA